MGREKENGGEVTGKKGFSASVTTGAVALVFLIIGFQTALFIHRAAVTSIVDNRDHPDTVYVVDRVLAEQVLADMADPDTAVPDGAADSRSDGNPTVVLDGGRSPRCMGMNGPAAGRAMSP